MTNLRLSVRVLLGIGLVNCAQSVTPQIENDLRVRVVEVRSGVEVPVSGAYGRAETAGNSVFVEAVSDENGVIDFGVDYTAGPWDVTVGRAGNALSAVSILDVSGPVDAPIHLLSFPIANGTPLATDCPAVTDGHCLNGSIRTLIPNGHLLFLGGPGVLLGATASTGTDSYRTTFLNDGTPTVRLFAIETDGTDLVAGWATPPVPRVDSDTTIDIVEPAERLFPMRSEIEVQLPTEGELTAANISWNVSGAPSIISSSGETGLGLGSLGPSANGGITWSFQTFPGDMAADFATFGFSAGNGPQALQGEIDTWRFSGDPIRVPSVNALSVQGTSLGDVTLAADGPAYTNAGFRIRVSDGSSVVGEWSGYSYGGSVLNARALPHLPSHLELEPDSATSRFAIEAVIIAAPAHQPWSRSLFHGVPRLRFDAFIGTTPIVVDRSGR